MPKTLPRCERLDMTFRATLPHDSRIAAPDPRIWPEWTMRVGRITADLVPNEFTKNRKGQHIAQGWRGQVELRQISAPDGTVVFDGLEVPTWQLVNPPRSWDDPARCDRGVGQQLDRLSRRFATAFVEWMDRVAELRQYLSLPTVEE